MPTLDSGPYVWDDWLDEQDAQTTYFRPNSVAQLIAYLEFVDATRLHIRAVGTGHSTSKVARPWRRPNDKTRAGIVVLPDSLALAWPDAAKAWWRDGVESSDNLFRVESGARISDLNKRFFDEGLAFPNLGSYDAQRIVGAIATGTHGTGMVTPPLCDLVASIELVTFFADADGKPELVHARIEPADGPTDPALFNAASSLHNMRLIQEDDAFYSCIVGLGFFGIASAVTLKLTKSFWLRETQTLYKWSDLKPMLPALADQDWFDFILSTRKTHRGPGGMEYKCLATSRTREPSLGWGVPRHDVRRERLLAKNKPNPVSLTKYLAGLASANPKIANYTAVGVFEDEVKTPHFDASHQIFRTSIGDLVLATSTEVSVPFDQVVPAVEAIMANNDVNDHDDLNQTSPFGVRFSQPSKHYLSMAYGRKTCTIEAPLLQFTDARSGPFRHASSREVITEILQRFDKAMRAAIPGARFHHGQRNFNTRADLEAYPKFQQWYAQYKRFNPFDIFSNELSAAWGL